MEIQKLKPPKSKPRGRAKEVIFPFVGFKIYSAKPHAWGKNKKGGKVGSRMLSYVGSSYDLEKVEAIIEKGKSGRVTPPGHGPDC